MKPKSLLLVLAGGTAAYAWHDRDFYRVSSARVRGFSYLDEGLAVRIELPREERFVCPGASVAWEGTTVVLTLLRTPRGATHEAPVPAEPIEGVGPEEEDEFWLRVPYPEGYDPEQTSGAYLRDPLFGELKLVAGFSRHTDYAPESWAEPTPEAR